MGKTKTLLIHGSPNVGLFGYATDSYCLIGKGLSDDAIKTFETSLDVPIHEITIGGSQQVGAYLNGTNELLLVPSVITPQEEKALKDIGIKYTIIDTINTALGNNLIVNENYFFYLPELEDKAVTAISEALNIEGEALELKDWEVIGSVVVINSQGGLIQKDVPEDVKKHIEEKLKIPLEEGTINFGSHVLGGGICVNKFGMVVGNLSAGIEITNADMAFGFLER